MPFTPAHARSPAPARLRWTTAFVLACVLLGAQGLGLWHRVVHGGHGWALARGVAWTAAGGEEPGEQRDAWPHVAGQADCLLLDDVLLADLHALPALVLPPPPALRPVRPVWPLLTWPAQAPRVYHARAPPRAQIG